MSDNALRHQVGGDHYNAHFKMQPVELIAACGWDFFQGNIAKYILRAPYKGGREDIEKAKHYCELGLELMPDRLTDRHYALIDLFVRLNGLSGEIAEVLHAIDYWHLWQVGDMIEECDWVSELGVEK